MRIPTPRELGMPAKFAAWRPAQVAFIEWLLASQKRTKAACAPTGFGKSLAVMGYVMITKRPTCIVTDNRALQDQYMDDFKSMGLVDIRGRRNYACELGPEMTCEEGYQARCPYKGTAGCPSSAAEMRAAVSSLVITNYDKWTAAKKYGTGMNHFEQVVFDEGHKASAALERAMQVQLNHREREQHLALDPPADTENLQAWKVWAVGAKEIVDAEFRRVSEELRVQSQPKASHVRHCLHMKNFAKRLSILSTMRAADWVTEEHDKGFQFDPVRPGRYAEAMLMLRVPSVVVVSATLRPKSLYMIGQGTDTFDFREFESEFDPKRCPIYWVPTMRVDGRATSLAPLWARLDQIAARRRDRKGIVHTVSYSRRDIIMEVSRFYSSMIVNPQGEPTRETIEAFKASPDGTILVSPSVGQGFDFPGPECEWQFLCKIPFPPPSKILKARTADDKEYPYYLAMQTMVQNFGRGMRFAGDQCVSPETRILTSSLTWTKAGDLKRGGHLLAFTEQGEGYDKRNKRNARRWQWSTIERLAHVKAPRLRVILEDGEIIVTPNHPLLLCAARLRTAIWRKAEQLQAGDRLIRLLYPWDAPQSYNAGWLAGFTDGEGSLIRRERSRNPNVSGLWLCQNEGEALRQAKLILSLLDFDYDLDEHKACRLLKVKGGYPEILRFLGAVRPTRLLLKFMQDKRGELLRAIAYPRVLAVEALALGEIIRLQTSSKTYISEGLGSHNCENFIADDHIEWFIGRYGHLAPKSFHGNFRRADILPQPPPRLPR